MTAPVCHITPPNQVGQPAPVQLQSIPMAPHQFDWNAVRAMLNQMKRAIETLSGQIGGSTSNQKKKNNKVGKYIEVDRQTAQVRITNPQDSNQYVDVLRINSLTFQDSVTGEKWTWNRGA